MQGREGIIIRVLSVDPQYQGPCRIVSPVGGSCSGVSCGVGSCGVGSCGKVCCYILHCVDLLGQ